MKVYKTNEIKNIAILGSSGTGKTTFAEAILFESGLIKRRGTIEGKNTVSDYTPVEKEYGYSVFSSLLSIEWKEKKMNFIDCPGSDDFIGGVISALNVSDMGLMLIDATSGVEVGTMNQFRLTEKFNAPVTFVINQLDHEKADYENALTNLQEIFGNKVVPVQYPISSGTSFNAIVDVLKRKMYKWEPGATAPDVLEIPESEKERANTYYQALLEAAAENDEGLMEKYFDKGTLTEEEMRDGIQIGMVNRDLFPVLCTSAEKNMAVHRVMNFLNVIAPSPNEMEAPLNTDVEEVKPDSEGSTSLLFFKTTIEPHIGEVSFFKVMSGTLKEGDDLINVDRQSRERIGQIYSIAGQLRTKTEQLLAGDIGAAVKLKNVKTGDTLNERSLEQRFDLIKYPEPRYRRAIKPVNESDAEKLNEALNLMCQEDPTWIVEISKELKQTIVSGQGEFH